MEEIIIDNIKIQYEFNEGMNNCKVVNSYLITNIDTQSQFIQKVITPCEGFNVRSVASYVHEWRAHNFLYNHNLWKSHTKDVDLNCDEPVYRRIIYCFLSILYKDNKKE